ncbi:site-specific integrase [Saccharothrix violaceirubra]|uniref:Site-specific recombinase XerD n=1 Tax=Saccharothrix violaceirubra TaxID=413306 RepID=A0A7W7T576_9PSEU|nr:site-specific integrase [Saccharothrix violaceirubra]MBB4966808.1 site-specific recombinase XerD [Saccharothrix violaceirubra]
MLIYFGRDGGVPGWRVFWVPQDAVRGGVRRAILADWADLAVREDEAGVRAGDPIFLSPDHRVDPLLSQYGQSKRFREYTTETRRNYATDICLFLTFLSGRGRVWTAATERDVEDYEHWRRFAEGNPHRVGGSKWDRELAAFASLYRWAVINHYVRRSPLAMKQVVGREGAVLTVPAARAKDARPSNVHWLTPRTWRRWIEVGLRGHSRDGAPEPGWVGRLEDRNVAFVRLLVTSGLRRAEGGSLLTFEVPVRQVDGARYYRGKVAAEVTRSKKPRTFYVAADAVGEIEAYVESSRAWVVRQAQKKGRYDRLRGRRVVTEVTRGRKPMVRWRDETGVTGERALDDLTARERMRLFAEGPRGLEPLWLWLNEQGLPFQVHSWEGVFTAANRRCERVLTPPNRMGFDPHQVFAPYATPHSARHSFALFMLVVLNTFMDLKYGLSPEERRDFRQLYGDPWFMVQCLLGHASRETTVDRYLAPVADLQLRSMLAGATEAAGPTAAPMPELDVVFARIARESEGIQDLDDRMWTAGGGIA